MIQSTKRVYLTLKTNEIIAREVAEQVIMRANPHDSTLTHNELVATDVTVENLQKYFLELSKAVCEFWHSQWDLTVSLTLKAHELRGLYLPMIYSVVFASVGNIKVGNYEFFLKSEGELKPDKKFLIDFSAKLESMRSHIKGATGQVGNRAAQPQSAVMLTLLSEVQETEKKATMLVRDGISYDSALAGLSVLAGISVVEQANSILYTGIDEVNFRQLTETLIEKGLVATKKPDSTSVD